MAQIKGGAKLEAFLKDLSKKVDKAGTMRAGFLEDATYPDGTPVATVAAINNFGAPATGTPPRPFMNNTAKRNEAKWGPELAAILKHDGYDVNMSLEQMGQHVAGQIREEIVNTMLPANSPVTNLLKQRFPTGDYEPDDVWQAFRDVAAGQDDAPAGKPLVWSGHMLNSVDSEVQE